MRTTILLLLAGCIQAQLPPLPPVQGTTNNLSMTNLFVMGPEEGWFIYNTPMRLKSVVVTNWSKSEFATMLAIPGADPVHYESGIISSNVIGWFTWRGKPIEVELESHVIGRTERSYKLKQVKEYQP